MSDQSGQLEVRRVRAGSQDRNRALHRVFDLAVPPAGAAPAPPVADLLSRARRGAVSIDLCFGAFQGARLVSAGLAVESAGGAALVCAASELSGAIEYQATVLVLGAVRKAAWERSLALLEALVPEGASALGSALREAGFHYLTRLRYLTRPNIAARRFAGIARDLAWAPYRADRELLFQEAVQRTYAQSLDCPELTGLRRVADVLAGHRATGVFDPALWWVAKRGSEPVGVLLLNRIPRSEALEIVYMGVAQVARGTGVADALLEQAVAAAGRVGARFVTLAVDARNIPARRLYARWDFVEMGARDAWIASSPGTRG
jgi:GNAT superfamily N-acetyltransferase